MRIASNALGAVCLGVRFPPSKCIGFLSFNKPAGLTLLKLVKLLGASVT
jgi:hypothetical protein